jgi:hypothetical protein
VREAQEKSGTRTILAAATARAKSDNSKTAMPLFLPHLSSHTAAAAALLGSDLF